MLERVSNTPVMMLETMLLSHISFILGLAIDYISSQCLVLAAALVASTRSWERASLTLTNMPRPARIAAATAAANEGTNPQVKNLTILSAKLGTKTLWEKVPHIDGTFELREGSAPTINLRLSEDCIRTSSGYRTNVFNLELDQFANRIGSAASKDIRHLEHQFLDDITVLEDVPVTLFIFKDINDAGDEIERYKIAF